MATKRRTKASDRRAFGRIEKLVSGRYRARYVGSDTLLHKAPDLFTAKLDAEAWLSAESRLISSGTWTPPAERARARQAVATFGPFAAEWLASRTLKPRTVEHYQRLLDRLILPTFAGVPLKAITPEVVRAWHTNIGPEHPTQRAHAYSLLRSILKDAVADELIATNPCHVRGAGNSKRVHKVQILTPAEVDALANAMPERLQLMALFAAWCGLRFGELVELRRSDLDVTNGVIKIRRGAVRVKGRIVIGTPKSDAGIRDVSWPPHLTAAVREHLRSFVTGRDGLLFPGAHGGTLQPSVLYGKAPTAVTDKTTGEKTVRPGWGFYAARAAIGYPLLRWHDLRHTGAVLSVLHGATLPDVMGRLGHSTPGAAMRYQHAAAGRDAEIAARMSESLGQ
ncbi:MAG: site-specific integrase [Actinomycetota bacterium]|nr:site-specific integrase [Actinomycetota bacterium]